MAIVLYFSDVIIPYKLVFLNQEKQLSLDAGLLI